MSNLKIVCPIDTFYDDADEEEFIQLLLAMQEEDQSQTGNIAKTSTKSAKEPPIVINLCGAKYEIKE